MRVIAGAAKGRRLQAPPGLRTRPLTDRAREGLFSSLAGRVEGARVLDLYAGSGAIGIEALSRGAGVVTLVERDPTAFRLLRANLAAVGLGGQAVAQEVSAFLDQAPPASFELVFVDPPFREALASVEMVLGKVAMVVAPGGLVVVHRRAGGAVPSLPDARVLPPLRYGDTVLHRFQMGAG